MTDNLHILSEYVKIATTDEAYIVPHKDDSIL